MNYRLKRGHQQHGRVPVPPTTRTPLAVRLLRTEELRGDVPEVRALREQGKEMITHTHTHTQAHDMSTAMES